MIFFGCSLDNFIGGTSAMSIVRAKNHSSAKTSTPNYFTHINTFEIICQRFAQLFDLTVFSVFESTIFSHFLCENMSGSNSLARRLIGNSRYLQFNMHFNFYGNFQQLILLKPTIKTRSRRGGPLRRNTIMISAR